MNQATSGDEQSKRAENKRISIHNVDTLESQETLKDKLRGLQHNKESSFKRVNQEERAVDSESVRRRIQQTKEKIKQESRDNEERS